MPFWRTGLATRVVWSIGGLYMLGLALVPLLGLPGKYNFILEVAIGFIITLAVWTSTILVLKLAGSRRE